MSNIVWPPSYYIIRDRVPFFLTVIYVYRDKLPQKIYDTLGIYLTFCAWACTGIAIGLRLLNFDMRYLAGIHWSAPSPIEWGLMITVLTGLLRKRGFHLFEAVYLSFITAMGGAWLYEFLPLLFRDFNFIIFFKVNAVKVFFVEFQVLCLPIALYIASQHSYRRSVFLIPSLIIFILWSAYRPLIEELVRDSLFYSYNWVIRLPAIMFLSVWLNGVCKV